MPEDVHFMPPEHLMQADEILKLATEFVNLGVTKIRLTGGEPLVRKDAVDIISALSKLPVELTLTTNGVLIDQYLAVFKAAGINSVNVSIDSLRAERFAEITKRNQFDRVWQNINLLLQNKIHVKLNVVLMKGINDDEIADFVALTKDLPVHVRFIEFMPFMGNQWQGASVVTMDEILQTLDPEFEFLKLKDEKHDTAKKYKVFGYEGTFAIITTMSDPFCDGCNRLRLTADGKMKNCLFSKEESDLLAALRAGKDIETHIKRNLMRKHFELGGQLQRDFKQMDASELENRSMVKIGG
jgi:cyclic pyranopterin phosphate synthase